MTPDNTTIVAGVAFSPHARLIASTAFVFAQQMNARVVFVHVGEDAPDIRSRLKDVLRAANVDNDCELVLQPGNPADVLIAVADKHRARLLVTGALETEGMIQKIFGSVARKVVRKAHCPVLLIPLNVQSIPRLDRVVMGIRSGEDIVSMLHFTLELLRSAGKTRLHIIQEADFMDRLTARYVEEREHDEFVNTQRSMLADALSVYDLSDIDVHVDILDGSAEGVAIVEYARNNGADLVVTLAPARALTLRDRFITHPAEAVMFRLPCGILLYRTPDESESRG